MRVHGVDGGNGITVAKVKGQRSKVKGQRSKVKGEVIGQSLGRRSDARMVFRKAVVALCPCTFNLAPLPCPLPFALLVLDPVRDWVYLCACAQPLSSSW